MLRCFQRRANIGEIMGKLGIQKKKAFLPPLSFPPLHRHPPRAGRCVRATFVMEKSAVPFNSALRGTSARRSGWDPAPMKAELIPKPFKSRFQRSFITTDTENPLQRFPKPFLPPLLTSSQPFHFFFPFPDPNRCFLNPNPG